MAPEGDTMLLSRKRAKSNAEEVIPITKTSDMTQGESIDTDVHDDTCSVESKLLEVEEIHQISKDEVDPGWMGMPDSEVGEILDKEVNGDHYEIKRHYFRDGNLVFVVQDAVFDMVSAKDYKKDFPHVLATCIRAKQFSTKNAKSWEEWANSHFKCVWRLFRRLE